MKASDCRMGADASMAGRARLVDVARKSGRFDPCLVGEVDTDNKVKIQEI